MPETYSDVSIDLIIVVSLVYLAQVNILKHGGPDILFSRVTVPLSATKRSLI